jgi:hypothetical protein
MVRYCARPASSRLAGSICCGVIAANWRRCPSKLAAASEAELTVDDDDDEDDDDDAAATDPSRA